MEQFPRRPVLGFCQPAGLRVIVLNNELSDVTIAENNYQAVTAAEIKVNPARDRKEFCTKYYPLLGYQSQC